MNHQRRTFPLTYMVNGVTKTKDLTIPRWMERYIPDTDGNGVPDQIDHMIAKNPELSNIFDIQDTNTTTSVHPTSPTPQEQIHSQSHTSETQISPTDKAKLQNLVRTIILFVGLFIIASIVF